MNIQEMKAAGRLSVIQIGLDDKQLSEVIEATELVLAFLNSKGPFWDMTINALYVELEVFRRFSDARLADKD